MKKQRKWKQSGEAIADINKIKRAFKIYGVPNELIDSAIGIMTNYALMESEAMRYDRINCAISLSLRNVYGWGQKRIYRVLQGFDDICKNAELPGQTWDDNFKEVYEQTGMIFGYGSEDRMFYELQGDDIDEARNA